MLGSGLWTALREFGGSTRNFYPVDMQIQMDLIVAGGNADLVGTAAGATTSQGVQENHRESQDAATLLGQSHSVFMVLRLFF